MKDDTKFDGGGSPKGNMSCADFDRLLADALDGVMAGPELAEFKSHATDCADCGPLFSHAEAGMNWMKSLAKVEPPMRLVHNILARTSMAEAQTAQRVPGAAVQDSLVDRVLGWVSPAIRPAFAAVMQPRFAMTAAMTFFSASMLLNLGGVKLKDLKYLDLRPSAITTTASVEYHETTARVVKYYENIRLVYELESRMKALKDASSESEQDNQNNAPTQQKKRDDSSSQERKQNKNEQQDEKEQRQYVSERQQMILALLRIGEGFAAPVKTDSRSFS